MKMSIPARAALAIAALAILSAGCGTTEPPPDAGEADTGEEAAQGHGEEQWGYGSGNGPEVWGELSPEFALCSEGTRQSPIDIVDPVSRDLPGIVFDYRPTELHVVNNGHTIQVDYDEGSSIEVGGDRYGLVQFHFHAPSEHTVDGQRFAMEMHLVHRDDTGELAVVGVLIRGGDAHEAFAAIQEHMPTEPDGSQHADGVTVDASHLLPADRLSYRYDGSLTTPPCSEGVRWLLLTDPIALSEAQIAAFERVFEGNNRPVQPLHDRQLAVDSTMD